jgi:hydrogenase/urease accessory protein HupE
MSPPSREYWRPWSWFGHTSGPSPWFSVVPIPGVEIGIAASLLMLGWLVSHPQ